MVKIDLKVGIVSPILVFWQYLANTTDFDHGSNGWNIPNKMKKEIINSEWGERLISDLLGGAEYHGGEWKLAAGKIPSKNHRHNQRSC